MSFIDQNRAPAVSSSGGLVDVARATLSSRRILILLAIGIVAAGIAFNWGWLVAAGIAPILVSLLPCAAMCALGLCMSRMAGGECGAQKSKEDGASAAAQPASTIEASVADHRLDAPARTANP